MSPKTKKKTPAEKPAIETSHRVLNKNRVIFLAVASSVLVILGAATAYAFYYKDRFLPHTEVAGVALGGLTKDAATTLLQDKATTFVARSILLTYADKQWTVTPNELGSTFAVTDEINRLWTEAKEGDWKHQLGILLKAPFTRRRAELGFSLYTPDGLKKLEETVKEIETPHTETSLAFNPGNVTIVDGVAGKRVDVDKIERSFYDLFKYNHDSSIGLTLVPFEPEVTKEMAEPARVHAGEVLSADWTIVYGDKSAKVTTAEMAQWLTTNVARDPDGTASGLTVVLNKEKIQAAVSEWATSIQRSAVNARIKYEGSSIQVIEDGKEGLSMNQPATIDRFSEAVGKEIPDNRKVVAVVDSLQPELRRDTLAQLGITQLIGTATTDFVGSPTNRKFNIGVGQRSLDRQLVKAGETFSTMRVLGHIDVSTGYLPELVIKGNRTVPEAGGGLCQVSTTLFRSVLNAGLPIVERQNHAYRVSYYEKDVGPGLDATIYDPNPDFKWKNDTGKAVFIQSYVKDTKITFELYGTSDGRVSSISKPTILEVYPVGNPIYSDTDTLFKGETKQIERAHDGAKTSVTYTVTRNGEQIYNRQFISVYRAWPAQYLVGTKEPPAA